MQNDPRLTEMVPHFFNLSGDEYRYVLIESNLSMLRETTITPKSEKPPC